MLAYMSWLRNHLSAQAGVLTPGALVTVIMPTFNRENVIRRAVLSVLTQSMPHFELIVVDDGSTDGTARLVDSFTDERIRWIRSESNQGHAYARNIGLEAARGKYIAFLDSDDWWDPHFLRIMLNRLQVSGHGFVYSAQRVLRPHVHSGLRRPELIRWAPYNASLLENTNYISQIAVLHEKSLALEAGGFNESYKKFADWEFFLRMAALSPPLALPVVLSHYNQSAQATVSSSESRAEYLRKLRSDLASVPIDLACLLSEPSGKLAFDGVGKPAPVPAPSGYLTGSVTSDFSRPSRPKDERGSEYPELFALRQPSSAISQRMSVIVIPSYGVPDYLRLCLASIRQFTDSGTFRVIVVDNASDRPVQDVLDEFDTLPQFSVVRNSMNLGFSRAVQQGIELTDQGEDTVIMNNDALVTPGWLNELSSVAHRYQDAGMVAPRQVVFPGDKGLKMHVPGAVDDFQADANLSAHHRNVIDPFFDTKRNIIELDFVPFFCVLVRREVIDSIGPLSPDMGVHYQSDWVYSDATRNIARRRILHTARSKVYHFSGRATRELRKRDSRTFDTMGVREDWRAVQLAHLQSSQQ